MIKEFVNYISSKEASDDTIKDYQLALNKIESDCNQDLNNIYAGYFKRIHPQNEKCWSDSDNCKA